MRVPTVVVSLGSAPMEMHPDWFTSSVNDVLFPRLGVLTPSIETVFKPDAQGVWKVTLDGTELGDVDVVRPAESIADLLASRAADLVTTCLVEFNLSRLQARLPSLAAAIQRQFSTADLVETLRRQVARGESIRDFAGALEEMLASAARAPQPAAAPAAQERAQA